MKQECTYCGKIFNDDKTFDSHPCSKEAVKFTDENPKAKFQELRDYMNGWIKTPPKIKVKGQVYVLAETPKKAIAKKSDYTSGVINWCFDIDVYSKVSSPIDEVDELDIIPYCEIIEPNTNCGKGFDEVAEIAKKWKEVTVYWNGDQFHIHKGNPENVKQKYEKLAATYKRLIAKEANKKQS